MGLTVSESTRMFEFLSRATWFDSSDVSTHVVYADGTRWAGCKAGSGQEIQLTRDEIQGGWYITDGRTRQRIPHRED